MDEDKASLDFMKKFVAFGHALGIFPYKLKENSRTSDDKNHDNSEDETPTVRWIYDRKSWRQSVTLAISFLFTGLYQAFLIFRSVECMLQGAKEPVKEKLKVFYLTGMFLFVNLFHLNNFIHFGKLGDFFNAVVDTIDRLTAGHSGKVKSKNGGENGYLRPYYRCCRIFVLFVGISRGLSTFKRPQSKLAITSLLFNGATTASPKDLYIWLRLSAAAFHFHVLSFAAFFLVFQPSAVIWFVASVVPMIKRLRLPKDKEEKSKGVFMSEEQLHRSFRSLQILEMYANQIYGLVPLATVIIGTFFGVMNIFVAAVHKDYAALVRVSILLVLVTTFFVKSAQVYEQSLQMIRSWKDSISGQQKNSMWFYKFQRSCRPLRISIGGFFFVDRAFVLTFITIVVVQSTNLILSYHKE